MIGHHIIAAAIGILVFLACGGAFASPDGSQLAAEDAVEEARSALHAAEFEALVPILESVVSGDDRDVEAPAEAHLLYALGLFYEEQHDDAQEGRSDIDEHLRQALRQEPGLTLDPLVYPPSFTARVEQIRGTMAGDSDAASTGAGSPSADNTPQIFYFERRVETRSRLPLYLPGGVGQFYNGHAFRGATFATVQGLGLATNAVGYWIIESLRSSSGHIPAEHVGQARTWRAAQITGIVVFAAGWLLSGIDAHLNFEPERVRIRTLDGPPPELEFFPEDEHGLRLGIQLQWGLTF